jgi:hypothetical protein
MSHNNNELQEEPPAISTSHNTTYTMNPVVEPSLNPEQQQLRLIEQLRVRSRMSFNSKTLHD